MLVVRGPRHTAIQLLQDQEGLGFAGVAGSDKSQLPQFVQGQVIIEIETKPCELEEL